MTSKTRQASASVATHTNGSAPETVVAPQVEIEIVRRTTKVRVDMDAWTWGDSIRFQRLRADHRAGTVDDETMITEVNNMVRKVTGQEPNDLPAHVVVRVLEVLREEDNAETGASKN